MVEQEGEKGERRERTGQGKKTQRAWREELGSGDSLWPPASSLPSPLTTPWAHPLPITFSWASPEQLFKMYILGPHPCTCCSSGVRSSSRVCFLTTPKMIPTHAQNQTLTWRWSDFWLLCNTGVFTLIGWFPRNPSPSRVGEINSTEWWNNSICGPK